MKKALKIRISGLHSPVPNLSDSFPQQGNNSNFQVGKTEDCTTIVECGAAWVDQESLAQQFCKNLMGMPHNQYVKSVSGQFEVPLLFFFGKNIFILVQQSDPSCH
jgi:hypothetical protein